MNSMITYCLDEFYEAYKNEYFYELPSSIHDAINTIQQNIVPIASDDNHSKSHSWSGEKRAHRGGRNRQSNHEKAKKDTWREPSPAFIPTVFMEKKESGIEKWLFDIRVSLNKLSEANYDNQKEEIFGCIENCLHFEDQTDEEKNENIKTIVVAIFNVASTNKFFVKLYARLYKELVNTYSVFQDHLMIQLSNYSNSIKDIKYSDPETDYEAYCLNNKENEKRKSFGVFLVFLMKEKLIPVLRILNIIVAFQTAVIEYVDVEDKTEIVDEITETLFLLLKEGKETFIECKAEWIWKFVIKQNVETFSKYTKKDKKSLSSRAIFKYMDMVKLIDV
jgi:hypothetical protein